MRRLAASTLIWLVVVAQGCSERRVPEDARVSETSWTKSEKHEKAPSHSARDGSASQSPVATPQKAAPIESTCPPEERLADDQYLLYTAVEKLDGLDDIVEIAAGASHFCARRGSGQVLCWGNNRIGQLGDGTTTGCKAPVPARGLSDALGLATGENHSCALLASGRVACWGQGKINSGGRRVSAWSRPIKGARDVVEIVPGDFGPFCVIKDGGQVACYEHYAQTWEGVKEIDGAVDIVDVAASGLSACGRTSSGRVLCWGLRQR